MQRLYEKAKQLGTWDPAAIDLSRDVEHWRGLARDERDFLFRVASLFFTAEAAVTRDLLPVAFLASKERRFDDELFVSAWILEEGKHADFFRRFIDGVTRNEFVLDPGELLQADRLFEVELHADMYRLFDDASPAAQTRAFTTYCLLLEGVLADAGQRTLEEALRARGLMPGLQEALVLVNRDESRHVAYGLHVLRRLLGADARMAEVVEARVAELTPLVIAVADAIMVRYEQRPFGLSYTLREPIQRLVAQLQRLAVTGRSDLQDIGG